MASILNDRMQNRKGGNNQRVAQMMGWLTKDQTIKATIPSKDRSNYAYENYKFLLDAPFDISNKCCNVMKKSPAHQYEKETGRYPIIATMASESKLRTQKWLQNGCNAFNTKRPHSNPMSFWLEQDVLLYIKLHNLEIAPVYGEIITEDEKAGQLTLADLISAEDKGVFDLDRPSLCTTGCKRTGCIFCMYGCHLEKRPNRLETMLEVTNPKLYDYMMRGGAFDEDGLWKPDKRGLGFWFPAEWINRHSKRINYYLPNIEHYIKEYGTEETRRYLEET